MNFQHDSTQQAGGRAPWTSPALTHFGPVHMLTATGRGLAAEYVLCERDDDGVPIPGTCRPYDIPPATRA